MPPFRTFPCALAMLTACAAVAHAGDPWAPTIASVGRHEVGLTNVDPAATEFASSLTTAIALVGDDLIVTRRPTSSDCAVGDALVYRWSDSGGWTRIADLLALVPTPPSGGVHGFGHSVVAGSSAGGDWIFVGAPCVDPSGPNGAVFAFRKSKDGSWAHARTLHAPPLSGNAFGSALAFDGTRLLVGQTGRDDVPNDLIQGGADAYTVVGDDLVGPSSMGLPFTPNMFGQFAASVAIAGDTAVLAGPNVGVFGSVQSGRLAVFARQSDDTWAFESIVESPQSTPMGKFGTSIAMAGDILAVAAPGETVLMTEDPPAPGATSEGVVSLFTRVPGGWAPRGAVADVPAQPLQTGVTKLALDGEHLVTGASGQTYEGAAGAATLYRVRSAEKGGAERIARASRTAEFNAFYASTGAQVAIGAGRFAFSRLAQEIDTSHRVVRALPVAAAAGDCDGDGIYDGDAILAGAVADCDDDLVPDPCEPDCDGDGEADVCAVAPTLAFVASATPADIGWGAGGASERVFMTRIVVPEGADGIVRGVASLWLATHGPHGAIVALYADPDQDGEPADAALLGAWGIEVTIAPGDERVEIPPTPVGAPGDSFFVAVGVRRLAGTAGFGPAILGAAPAGEEAATWTAAYEIGGFDPADPWERGYELLADEWPLYPNIVCAAIFASPLDQDGDGVPDACACAADLDRDGAVGPTDLAFLVGAWGGGGAADLDGDGAVGAADLGILLGAWGPCP